VPDHAIIIIPDGTPEEVKHKLTEQAALKGAGLTLLFAPTQVLGLADRLTAASTSVQGFAID
jgi:hypothetical protein